MVVISCVKTMAHGIVSAHVRGDDYNHAVPEKQLEVGVTGTTVIQESTLRPKRQVKRPTLLSIAKTF